MSFRVGTPNYGLPQTEGTDKRDWSDTNQPFLAIDTAIKNAVDTSASASSAAATAQQTADSATTAATHAQTDATTAQTLANTASEAATLAKSTADNANTLAQRATASSGSVTLETLLGMNNPEVQYSREGKVCCIHYAAQLSVYSYSGWNKIGSVSNEYKPSFNVTTGMVIAGDQNANGRARVTPSGDIEINLPSTIQSSIPTYLDITFTYVK